MLSIRRRTAVVLLVLAVVVWVAWLAYIARAIQSNVVPVTWGIFGLFLAGILLFLVPSLLLFYPYRDRYSPYRFHVAVWLVTTGLFWIFAPIYQYLSVNTNRELVLWYMIPYAWEVPVMGYLYFAPLYHRFQKILEELARYKQHKPIDVAALRKKIVYLPVFAGGYFAFIALLAYGPIGSYQFRIFGGAPWPEIVKNIVTGTAMGFVSGTLMFFVLNLVLAPYLETLPPIKETVPFPLGRKLAMIATTLVAVAFLVYVPVAYRNAQNLLAAQTNRYLASVLIDCTTQQKARDARPCDGLELGGRGYFFLMDRSGRVVSHHPIGLRDVQDEGFEAAVEAALVHDPTGFIEPTSLVSYRTETRYVSFLRFVDPTVRSGQLTLVGVAYEDEFLSALNPFLADSLTMGIAFGIIFTLLIILMTRGISAPLQRLTAAVQTLAARGRPKPIRMGTGDEVDVLGYEFSAMARQLRSYEQGLERKIAARTAELARVNTVLAEKNSVLERVIVDVERFDRELKRLNAAKSEFISMASHQLRTPLTAIKWYANLFSHAGLGALSPSQRRTFRQIAETNQRMIDLVNALLNVSRLEVGTLAIEPKPTRLDGMLRELIRELAPLSLAHRVAVRVKALPAITLRVDQRLLGEAVMNLLTNAVRYTPPGGRVSVELGYKGPHVVISVTDTGYGIPEKDRKLLFSKFFRASNVQQKEPHGTGLGLHITKAVVEAMGGTIGFVSEENKGSTFWITLPRAGVKARAGTRTLQSMRVTVS